MWRPRRGFTWIETLVAIFLMALASTLMSGFFIYTVRQNRRYEGRQELILGVESTLLRILSQFHGSRASALRFDSSIAGIVFPLPVAVNSSVARLDTLGAPLWSSWQAFGWDSSSRTVWEANRAFLLAVTQGGELSSGPTTSPATWTRTVLARSVREFQPTISGTGGLRVRILAQDAQGFQVEMTSTGVAQN